MTGDGAREDVAAITRELYARGVLTGVGGNVSARVAPGAEGAWITPRQVWKGGLVPADLVRIGLDGEPLEQGARAPSSERRFHAAILRARPDVNAVVHGHAPHATALVLAGLPVRPISTEAAFLGEVPVLPYLAPGSPELARAVEEAFARRCVAALLQNHGFITVGPTVRHAANLAEILEHTAQLLILCRALGREPPALDAAAVEEVRRAYA